MKLQIRFLTGIALGCFMVTAASAIPIELVPPSPASTINDNPATELAALVSGIAAYNTATPASLPTAGAIDTTPQVISGFTNSGDGHVVAPAGLTSITIDFSVEHETYLILQWDGLDGHDFWYVGGETGVVTFNNTDVLNRQEHPQGLSHYLFTGPGTSVPDGGATMALLGVGLLGIAGFRRRLIRR